MSTNGVLHDLNIPLGNLLGSNLLLGRGPKILVKMLRPWEIKSTEVVSEVLVGQVSQAYFSLNSP